MDQYKNKIFSLSNISMLILYICFLGLLIRAVDKKINYHTDEIFSYGQANYQKGKNLEFEDGLKYSPPESIFLKYLTVDEQHRFDYKNVWKNQITNVHPALFHSLVHTVCSFFPGSFSKWYAAVINIFFLLITLYFVGKITELISDRDRIIKFLVSLVFISSFGIISAGTFLRMYCMAMCWNTMLCRLLLRESAKKRSGLNFYIFLFFIASLGALTHYYCIVFTVFSCAVYMVILLIHKRYRMIWQLILTGIVSALTVYAVWPYIIKHLRSSYRGVEAVKNLNESFDIYLPKLTQYWSILIHDLFGGRNEFFIVPLGAVILFFMISRFLKMKNQNKPVAPADNTSALKTERFLILWLPLIAYFLLIAKIAPYQTDRYIFPIYPLTLIGVFCFFFTALKKIPVKNAYIFPACICLIALVYFEWQKPDLPYQYLYSSEILEKAKKYHDSDCIYVYKYRTGWHTYPSYLELSNYNSVTFIGDNNLNLINEIELNNARDLIVFIDNDSPGLLDIVKNFFPNPESYEKIGKYFYATSYVFHPDGE